MKKLLYILTLLPFCLFAQPNQNGVATLGGGGQPDGNGHFDIANTSDSIDIDTAYFHKDLSYLLENNNFSLLNIGSTGSFAAYEGTSFSPTQSGFYTRKGDFFLNASSGGTLNYFRGNSSNQTADIFLSGVARMKQDYNFGGFDLSYQNFVDSRNFQLRYENNSDRFYLQSNNASPYHSFPVINNFTIAGDEKIYFNVSVNNSTLIDSTGVEMPYANARQLGLSAGNYVWQVDENGRNGQWVMPSGGGTADGVINALFMSGSGNISKTITATTTLGTNINGTFLDSDEQNLSYNNTTGELSINNGNTVTINVEEIDDGSNIWQLVTSGLTSCPSAGHYTIDLNDKAKYNRVNNTVRMTGTFEVTITNTNVCPVSFSASFSPQGIGLPSMGGGFTPFETVIGDITMSKIVNDANAVDFRSYNGRVSPILNSPTSHSFDFLVGGNGQAMATGTYKLYYDISYSTQSNSN